MIQLARLLRHLSTTRWRLHRLFPTSTLAAIRQAIDANDAAHTGHIRFAVESGLHGSPLLHGQTSQARALDVFSQLRVWDTEQNNGVLIYVLLADRAVEIVADRGISARVSGEEWEKICHRMNQAYALGNYEAGSIDGIRAVTQCLVAHFPESRDNHEAFPDEPVVL